MTFCGGIDWSVLLRVVRFFCVAYLYFPRDARYDFSLFRVCSEADAFKEDHEDL